MLFTRQRNRLGRPRHLFCKQLGDCLINLAFGDLIPGKQLPAFVGSQEFQGRDSLVRMVNNAVQQHPEMIEEASSRSLLKQVGAVFQPAIE